MKILILAGHGAGDPGACSSYGIEANETRRVVSALKSQFGAYNIDVDIYPTDRNAYEDVKNGRVQVNFANYDYVLEIHFNSSANSSANGVEVWVTNAESGTTVEQLIVNKIASLGYLNRGVKREDFAVIRSAKNKGVSSALVEVCFISNQGDMDKYNKNFDNICKAIVEGVGEGFSLTKNNNVIAVPKPIVIAPVEQSKSLYRVKTSDGKQLGAFSVLENAKAMASNNKAIVYDVSNKEIVSYVPKVSSEKRYAENGTYYFSTAVTVRTAPEENAKTNVVYYAGESVIYHHVILNKNEFNWIEYARSNGTTGYLKIKDLSNGESYGYAK